MIKLREWQERGMDALRESIKKGNKRILLVAPPGAGKGTLICHLAVNAVAKGKRVLMSVHKRDLIHGPNTISERFVKQFGFRDFGFYLSGLEQREKPVMLGTVQTMIRRKTSRFDIVIVDETHRIQTGSYQELMRHYPDVLLIGFTATPFRYDKKGFREQFDDLVQLTTYNEQVALGALVPTKVIAPKIAPDLDGVHTRAGDYIDSELFKKYDDERIYRGVVERWLKEAPGQKTIVFNVNSKKHSQKTAEWFREYGIDARAIDADTPKEDRLRLMQQFEKGDYPVLCNIGLFTEGISIDDVKCIIFNVATQSLTKWIQAGARGSRPVYSGGEWKKNPDGTPFKDHVLILDFGANCERHGFIDDYDLFPFSLDATRKKTGEAPVRTCPVCETVNPVQRKVCECGYVFPVKEKKKVYSDEAEWKELDRTKSLVKRLSEMNYYRMEKELTKHPKPHLLRLIALSKGFKPNWAVFQAYHLGYTEIKPEKENPRSFMKINIFLDEKEKEANVYEMRKGLQEIVSEPFR